MASFSELDHFLLMAERKYGYASVMHFLKLLIEELPEESTAFDPLRESGYAVQGVHNLLTDELLTSEFPPIDGTGASYSTGISYSLSKIVKASREQFHNGVGDPLPFIVEKIAGLGKSKKLLGRLGTLARQNSVALRANTVALDIDSGTSYGHYSTESVRAKAAGVGGAFRLVDSIRERSSAVTTSGLTNRFSIYASDDDELSLANAKASTRIGGDHGSVRFGGQTAANLFGGDDELLADDERYFYLVKDAQSGNPLYLSRSKPSMLSEAETIVEVDFDDIQELMRTYNIIEEAEFSEITGAPLQISVEVGMLGTIWRSILRAIILASYDHVNGLALSRGLQDFVQFLSGHEAVMLNRLMAALESPKKTRALRVALSACLKNRNTSRIIVQQVSSSSWDWFWHTHTWIHWNRVYDGIGKIPVLNWFFPLGFPASENFPSTRAHAVASVFRVLLGRGSWVTRTLTGFEELTTFNPNFIAQNLAAEGNGFEQANRNQVGNYFGRKHTNAFRKSHRLPTDESIVRTFLSTPASTMINNGVEHVLLCLGRHWNNMLYQFSGNFAHQRMEQLNPIGILRTHVPPVMLLLSTLRGISKWDSNVLAPLLRKLQNLRPIFQLKELDGLLEECIAISDDLCGGVEARSYAFRTWMESIRDSLPHYETEANAIASILDEDVRVGIEYCLDMLTDVKWKVPSDEELIKAIKTYCKNPDSTSTEINGISRITIIRAMYLLSPKDKRTLLELMRERATRNSLPAKLLIGRVRTLLARELRRDSMDEWIASASQDEIVTDLKIGQPVYIVSADNSLLRSDVYTYEGSNVATKRYAFKHRMTRTSKWIDKAHLGKNGVLTVRHYLPVAEFISIAQKAFMQIELHHGKKFSYFAFMELADLRKDLRSLQVVSQVQCSTLDDIKLVMLKLAQEEAIKKIHITSYHQLVQNKTYYTYSTDPLQYSTENQYKKLVITKPVKSNADFEAMTTGQNRRIVRVPPQNMIVVGGGPCGLLTTLHCAEAVIASNGWLRLFESRDAFIQGGATFERAQIIRLDARWIAMLRYHLGTIYEDVYIPANGETDSHYGNTLPTQGFVEITIKDLEAMMHLGVSKLDSMGLIEHKTKSGAQYNPNTNVLKKKGSALKTNDLVRLSYDYDGKKMSDGAKPLPWKVTNVNRVEPLNANQVHVGMQYSIWVPSKRKMCTFQLVSANITTGFFTFRALNNNSYIPLESEKEEEDELICENFILPAVYPYGTKDHRGTEHLVLEPAISASLGAKLFEETKSESDKKQLKLVYDEIEKDDFVIDTSHTHVFEAIGKQHLSPVHFSAATYEPYGVACITGPKVSMIMHRFGNRRWNNGILDDIRSHTDQNTRIVGDFTKTVNSAMIAQIMHEKVAKDYNWRQHFRSFFEELSTPLDVLVERAVKTYKDMAPFVRTHLQVRFFETGDNYYLGMEFTREYDFWKGTTVEELTSPIVLKRMKSSNKKQNNERALNRFKGSVSHAFDRLWFESALETIHRADVYNPGGHTKVPTLYLINSYEDTTLGKLPLCESFRLVSDPRERYDILCCTCATSPNYVLVRTVEGMVSYMHKNTKVRRDGNLSRGPDGNAESKVALATFPVGHYVNFRSMRVSNSESGYVFAFGGDEQSTPHFMRYSGLTGAAINAMLFNNFLTDALDSLDFVGRFNLYSKETNWNNGEVVQRGTGANYGEDGFLRPGFSYEHGMDYLHSKVIEYYESNQDLDEVLSRDWRIKVAASWVPRGLESCDQYISNLRSVLGKTCFQKLTKQVKANSLLKGNEQIIDTLTAKFDSMMTSSNMLVDSGEFWPSLNKLPLSLSDEEQDALKKEVMFVEKCAFNSNAVILHAKQLYKDNGRISSQGYSNQPKPVDSIVDSFAVEAQNFANGLNFSATLLAGAQASGIFDSNNSSNDSSSGPDTTTVGFIVGAVLSGITPWIAVGTITNASRYKNRNELYREEFLNSKYSRILLDAFKLVDEEGRSQIPLDENPFYMKAKELADIYIKKYYYYYNENNDDFIFAFERLKMNFMSKQAIQDFIDRLLNDFILYEVSSYLQQHLVDLYELMMEMLLLTKNSGSVRTGSHNGYSRGLSRGLYRRLFLFKDRLEPTLQRGPIAFGFFKQRSIRHTHLLATFQYFYNKMYCYRTGVNSFPTSVEAADQVSNSTMKPIAAEAYEIAEQMETLSNEINVKCARATHELRSLHYATTESYVTSLVIISGFISFFTSIVFTTGNICLAIDNDINACKDIQTGSFWALGITSPIAAYLVVLMLSRKMGHLSTLGFALRRKAPLAENSGALYKSLHLLHTQQLATLMRIIAALAAAVALIGAWFNNVDELGYNPDEEIDGYAVEYVALGSLGLQVFSSIFLFVIEYSLRYNLSPKLGEYLCESFKIEIGNMKDTYTKSIWRNDVKTDQEQDKTLWEYVAREFLHRYRFDTLFGADRFGNIMQYLQTGLNEDRYVQVTHFATASVRNFFDESSRKSSQGGAKNSVGGSLFPNNRGSISGNRSSTGGMRYRGAPLVDIQEEPLQTGKAKVVTLV